MDIHNKLGYTSYPKLESGLDQLSQGTALNAWNTIKATVIPTTNTLQSFATCIAAFCRIFLPEPAVIENQKAYMQQIKKNDRLTVPLFSDRLKQLNLLLT